MNPTLLSYLTYTKDETLLYAVLMNNRTGTGTFFPKVRGAIVELRTRPLGGSHPKISTDVTGCVSGKPSKYLSSDQLQGSLENRFSDRHERQSMNHRLVTLPPGLELAQGFYCGRIFVPVASHLGFKFYQYPQSGDFSWCIYITRTRVPWRLAIKPTGSCMLYFFFSQCQSCYFD